MASIPDATVTHELDPLPTAVEEIADLARRATDWEPRGYDVNGDGDRSVLVVRTRHDERIDIFDLERHLGEPKRARGAVTVHDPTDFIDYTNRLANAEHTTVWANVDTGSVTTLINDHATWDEAGWRDHTIKLALQPDEDWQKWTQRDGKLVGQADFAEFIEDVAHTVVHPDAATMLEVATTMSAKRSVDFSQATRLQTGDVQLRYSETTDAKAGVKGQLEVPERITVRMAPWRGVIVADLEARLRWRIHDGQLFIGYKLLRPDVFRADVFEGLIEHIRDGLDGVPLYRGATPNSLRQ